MTVKVYFDHNASSSLAPEVKELLRDFNDVCFGNPSSIHGAGQEARKILNTSRDQLARLLNCEEEEIIFTSGGTESINTAILGLAELASGEKREIISSPIEHYATLRSLEYLKSKGFAVHFLKIDRQGRFRLEELREKLSEKTFLVSLMWAHNEIGNLYPVREVAKLCQEKGTLFHCDGVQAAGKLKIDLRAFPIDLLSLSAHKFHGPQGVGLLYLRRGVKISPLHWGGKQERALRGGTPNLSGIYGMAKALEICVKNMEESVAHLLKLRQKLEEGILSKIDGVELNGDPENRLCNTSNFTVKGVDGESLLFNLDLQGVAASAGAACESGSIDPSHVLLTLGRSVREAKASLRLSLSKYNTEKEIDFVLEILPKIVERIRRRN